MHVYYIKCNTNVRRRDFGEAVVWKGWIPCIYIQGNGVSCAKKVGTELAQQRSSGSTVFDGGFLRYEKRGMVLSARVFRVVRGRGRGGMEWNGVEHSARRARGGVPRSRGGLKIDNAIPRLPLPPSTRLAPAGASIFFASMFLLLPSTSSTLLAPLAVVRRPASFRNVNSINATPFLFSFEKGE